VTTRELTVSESVAVLFALAVLLATLAFASHVANA
jgi:hypothetical protein